MTNTTYSNRDTRDLIGDERGASFVIALLFFLVCAMISVVIVSMASANIEHTRQTAVDSQSYNSVVSAGALMDGIVGNEFDIFKGTVQPDGTIVWTGVPNNVMADFITTNLPAAIAGGSPESAPIPITASGTPDGETYPNCSVVLSMEHDDASTATSNVTITARFTLDATQDADHSNYAYAYTIKHTYGWDDLSGIDTINGTTIPGGTISKLKVISSS